MQCEPTSHPLATQAWELRKFRHHRFSYLRGWLALRGLYCLTRNCRLLFSVPEGVFTFTKPVVAPEGTVVVIKERETTVKTAAVPLNLTLVAPVRSVPRILTAAPTLPEVGCVFTNGYSRPGSSTAHSSTPAKQETGRLLYVCRSGGFAAERA